MLRKVESTSGINEGCGLLKRPSSANAVTKRNPPLVFFTRKEGFKYSIVIPKDFGRAKTP